jgi:hypothetical protein
MTKHKKELVPGSGAHRRTESDYMGVLLDTVSMNDWRDVVAEALLLAKQGDSQARAWLAQYLVGKPDAKAPTPLAVVVNQWSGVDPVVEKLAAPLIAREEFPFLRENDGVKNHILTAIAEEMEEKLPNDFGNSSELRS